MTKKISILGCGWMGLPLARLFLGKGWKVKGSTTREVRLVELSKVGMESFCIKCVPQLQGRNCDYFFSSDVIFINIPFFKNLENPYYYKDQIISIVEAIQKSSIKKLYLPAQRRFIQIVCVRRMKMLNLSPKLNGRVFC